MTAKEKASEIYQKYKKNLRADNRSWLIEVKQCAIICVEEQIELLEFVYGSQKHMWTSHENETYSYLLNVKEYINEY